ncbi:hypothetical protein ABN702_09015 [Bacillus haimaensis]|uniref:hypothetical protein n=1 Tax=Bacillus haimaensis TaxID=3160967 RepID=UPI003AA9A16C
MRMMALLLILIAGISSIGCSMKEMKEMEAPEPVVEKELSAEDTALAAVKLLKERDFSALKDLIHPTKGVRFTPYGYIDVEKNLVFSAGEVGALKENQQIYLWGNMMAQATRLSCPSMNTIKSLSMMLTIYKQRKYPLTRDLVMAIA